MNGLDKVIAWSFKDRLEHDLGHDYWQSIEEELWTVHKLTINEIIQNDYMLFHEKLASLVGTKGASEIEKKCMNDILKIHKDYELYKISFYDKSLGKMILEAYSKETKKKILMELHQNTKYLKDIFHSNDFNHTSFYRNVKELIHDGLIVNVNDSIKTDKDGRARHVPQYTALFSEIYISIGNKMDTISATISKEIKEDSMILTALEHV